MATSTLKQLLNYDFIHSIAFFLFIPPYPKFKGCLCQWVDDHGVGLSRFLDQCGRSCSTWTESTWSWTRWSSMAQWPRHPENGSWLPYSWWILALKIDLAAGCEGKCVCVCGGGLCYLFVNFHLIGKTVHFWMIPQAFPIDLSGQTNTGKVFETGCVCICQCFGQTCEPVDPNRLDACTCLQLVMYVLYLVHK